MESTTSANNVPKILKLINLEWTKFLLTKVEECDDFSKPRISCIIPFDAKNRANK